MFCSVTRLAALETAIQVQPEMLAFRHRHFLPGPPVMLGIVTPVYTAQPTWILNSPDLSLDEGYSKVGSLHGPPSPYTTLERIPDASCLLASGTAHSSEDNL